MGCGDGMGCGPVGGLTSVGPMARHGCRELEPDPAAALLEQTLMGSGC